MQNYFLGNCTARTGCASALRPVLEIETATVSTLRQCHTAGERNMTGPTSSNDLVDRKIVRLWLTWGFFWAILAPIIGILLSLMFTFPTFLGTQWTHFGRLRPLHVNGVILGAFSSIFLGLVYYMVPKLAGVRMYREEWSKFALWLWNGTLAVAMVSLLLGHNKGLEVAEFPNPLPLFLAAALFLIAYQVFMTIARRKEEKIFVSLWYIIAALIWTAINFLYGNLVIPYAMPGITSTRK
jgi:cbb3-type cytochrome oxidase subunit 1